jgi:CheY-like chemotaxis protein
MNTALDQFRMKKALIVEDNPDLLDLLTIQMEWMGFTVIAAKHGKEGVEKAFKEKPHLIVMDILMPGMDGREATRLIRSNPETHDIPILAATVLNKKSELEACIEAGCDDCLVKPFTLKQLQGKVQEFLPTSSPTIH